jgi:NAD(P)-dependent dehydrogenase (short-subunit alcohol dehydrogenase family)
MQDKVVVVTGGTSGIGQVAAETLASQGARIVLIARDQARAAETACPWNLRMKRLMQATTTTRFIKRFFVIIGSRK